MKKLKPVIIQCCRNFFIGLVNNEKEDRYYKFMNPSYKSLVEEEHRTPLDYIYEMTPTLYFEISSAFKNKGLVYNLKKHKHIFNDRK